MARTGGLFGYEWDAATNSDTNSHINRIAHIANVAPDTHHAKLTARFGKCKSELTCARGTTRRDSILGLMDILGALYSSTVFMGIANALIVLPVVAAERAVVYRERSSRMYSTLTYSMAQGMAELPYLLAQVSALKGLASISVCTCVCPCSASMRCSALAASGSGMTIRNHAALRAKWYMAT